MSSGAAADAEVAAAPNASQGSMGTSKLSSGIDSVSDQKLSSNWNSSASGDEVQLSSLGNPGELPVLPCSVTDDSVTDDDADRSGDTGAAAAAAAGAFLAPPRFAAAGLRFLPLPPAGASCAASSPLVASSRFFRFVCQTFLISLSVRPGSLAAIADHLRPKQFRARQLRSSDERISLSTSR